MAVTIQTHAEAFNTKYSVSVAPIVTAGTGDEVDAWGLSVVNPVIEIINELHNVTDGQIYVGSTADNCLVKTTPTGSHGAVVTAGAGTLNTSISLTGDVTGYGDSTLIADNAVTTSKIADANVTPAKLDTAARTQFAQSIVELNLAGGSQSGVFIFAPDVACTIISCYLIYTVVSGSVAATISIGKPGNATYYLNASTTNTSAAQWDKQALTLALTATDIGANQAVFCSTDGVGDAGKVLAVISYKVN